MIAYEDIKDMTNEEADAYYGSLTYKKILCGDLENLLNWGGYANRNSVTGAWEGVLIDFMNETYVDEFGLASLAEGLEELFTHLNQPRSVTIDTTTQPWAGKMEALLNGLVLSGIVDTDLMYDVIALGGGQPNADTDYQAVRDNHESAVVASANSIKHADLFNQHVSPVLSGSDAEIIAALNAMASNWSN